MAEAGRFPIRIDFTAWLAIEGVDVPNAAIVIHSTYIDLDIPPNEWPENVSYHLGDNQTSKQTLFAAMLANYAGHKPNQDWFCGRISRATLSEM